MKPDGSLTQLEMWSYWRGKYGYEYALKDYYPDLYESDFILKNCLMQIKAARIMIDEHMQQYCGECRYEMENKLNGERDRLAFVHAPTGLLKSKRINYGIHGKHDAESTRSFACF